MFLVKSEHRRDKRLDYFESLVLVGPSTENTNGRTSTVPMRSCEGCNSTLEPHAAKPTIAKAKPAPTRLRESMVITAPNKTKKRFKLKSYEETLYITSVAVVCEEVAFKQFFALVQKIRRMLRDTVRLFSNGDG
jgi:hypothetical protein